MEHQPLTDTSPTEQPYLARRQNWTNQLARHALMQPDATALRFLGHTTTWAELDRRVTVLAGALRRRGVGFGDRVLILMLNRTEFIESFLAANKIGAIAVPVNFRMTPPEIAFLVSDCQARVVITEAVLAKVATAVRDIDPTLQTVIVAGGGTDDDVAGYEDLISESGDEPQPVDIPNDSPALIMYTSGTTGRPKGAVLTHNNIAFQAMTNLFTISPDINLDVGFIGVPLFHVAGIGNMISGLLLGLPHCALPARRIRSGCAARRARRREGVIDVPGARPVAGGMRRAATESAATSVAGAVVGCSSGVGHLAAQHGRVVPRRADLCGIRPDGDVAGDLYVVGAGRNSQARLGRKGDSDGGRASGRRQYE